MSKRLLHELGHSLSYGRLSLKAKVLWPLLIASSDDQGRGLAECDAVKWYVCPNVPEITVDDVGDLLQEMVDQGMIVIYDTERGQAYQMVRWWEYQQLQWARSSRLPPPEGWVDRVRYSNRGDYHSDNWETPGGFEADLGDTPAPEESAEPPRKPPRKPEPNQVDFQPNLTQPNLTQLNPCPTGADAPSPSPQPPQTFQEWEKALDTYSNHPALLHRMIDIYYPGLDPPPDYGEIGAIAKKMGRGKNGYRRLMALVWEYSTRPPTGELLPYLLRVHQGKGRDDGRTRQRQGGGGATELSPESQAIAAALAGDEPTGGGGGPGP